MVSITRIILLLFIATALPSTAFAEQLNCDNPYIIDGDTFDCSGTRIRLAGIDAPEIEGHCRPGRECTAGDADAARLHLNTLTRAKVACTVVDVDRYGRSIASCTADGIDLSCAMIASGHAVPRYRDITCPAGP